MERFGDELRQERERRQISVERICEETKVSARHVLALEAGEYGELPGGVFRKGILRSYLAAMGLDELTWMQRFEKSLEESGMAGPNGSEWVEFAENVRRSRPAVESRNSVRWMGVAMMLLSLAALGWSVWRFALHSRFF